MLLNITHKTSCNHLMQASQCSLGDAIVLTYRGWTWRIIRFCETAFFFLFGSLPAIGMLSLSGWTWPPSTSGYIYTSSESFNLFCFWFFCWEKWGGGLRRAKVWLGGATMLAITDQRAPKGWKKNAESGARSFPSLHFAPHTCSFDKWAGTVFYFPP